MKELILKYKDLLHKAFINNFRNEMNTMIIPLDNEWIFCDWTGRNRYSHRGSDIRAKNYIFHVKCSIEYERPTATLLFNEDSESKYMCPFCEKDVPSKVMTAGNVIIRMSNINE